ncbi:sporulation integral membrane protein YlbJ [Bacillus sp. AFS001701]|uniref:sporulation integral membrane protein YlbJ n=1 Tax=Gottfriedia acidiceleris TaxID=371036 RepID=UPI000BF29301|nr:sporulation integral membrane protein YlbJ [Bacillus sp. AFS001701]
MFFKFIFGGLYVKKNYFITLLIFLLLIFLTSTIILHPEVAFKGSIRGLNMWWGIVFPSLLPFFILSELLICFGIVQFIGVFLEPVMRPLFRVPGVGAFVWAMGMASGFPSGAKLSAKLYKDGELTKLEAERLNSFTNSSNPLFIFVAISVGFFHNPKVGLVLALSHYLSNAIVGLIMRFYGRNQPNYSRKERIHSNRFKYAFKVMHEKRLSERRPIGKILGDAIASSVQTLLMIGGFIIVFSVLNMLLIEIGFISNVGKIIAYCFSNLKVNHNLSTPFLSGLFEITLGSKLVSELGNSTLLQQVALTSFILGFGGFSIQAQVASIISEVKLSIKPYLIGRLLQSGIAPILAIIFWKPLYLNQLTSNVTNNTLPVIKIFTEKQLTLESLISTGSFITLISLYIYVIILIYKLYIKKLSS